MNRMAQIAALAAGLAASACGVAAAELRGPRGDTP